MVGYFTRPIFFCYRKYNMDLTTGSLLLEIGSNANTLDESIYSAELIGNSLASCKPQVLPPFGNAHCAVLASGDNHELGGFAAVDLERTCVEVTAPRRRDAPSRKDATTR